MQAVESKKDMFKDNPSIISISRLLKYDKKVVRYKEKREAIINGEEKVVYPTESIEVIRDNKEFVKLYLEDVNSVKSFSDLTISTQKLLCYIFGKVEHNVDFIIRLDGEISKNTGLSSSTIYKGFYELLEKKWLFKSDIKYKYWINIELFFKGDRSKVLEEYYKISR